MKIKNAALFLIISAALWVIAGVYQLMFMYKLFESFTQHWEDFVISVLLLCVPVVYIGWSITFFDPGRKQTSKGAVFLAVITGIWTGIELYYRVTGAAQLHELYYERNPVFLYVVVNLRSLVPLLMFIASVLWTTGKPGNIRKGAVFLMAGALLWLFSMMGERMELLFTNQWRYILKEGRFRDIFLVSKLLYPVALFVLGIALVKHPAPENVIGESLEDEGEDRNVILTVLDWFITFLWVSVPFAGIILLIIWGINPKNKPRKTWALNTLLWTILAWALNIFIYLPALRILRPGTSYYYIALIVWIMLAIVTGILLYAHIMEKRERIFEEEEEDYYPVSVKKWMFYTFMVGVPIIGIICLVSWAVDHTNQLRRNWALARLLWLGVMVIFIFYLYTTMVEIKWLNSQRLYFQF